MKTQMTRRGHLGLLQPRGLHQHGLDLGPHAQIDASALRYAGFGTKP
jgi:hypothetical protein